MAAKLYFIFCTLYNLHQFKMAANMLNTDYYNYITITLISHAQPSVSAAEFIRVNNKLIVAACQELVSNGGLS